MAPAGLSDVVDLITLFGVPANTAAILAAFWFIDRRLVRIETLQKLNNGHVDAQQQAAAPRDRERRRPF